MSRVTFSDFQLTTTPTTGDFLVGYNQAGTAETRIRVSTLASLVSSSGVQGVRGLSGVQGIPGLSAVGVQGLQGLSAVGVQGLQGLSAVGVQGLQGIPGLSAVGVQGIQGLSAVGVQGFRGIQGTDGIITLSSVNLLQGVQGVQGINNSADILPTVINYLSSNNVQISALTIGMSLQNVERVLNEKVFRLTFSTTPQEFYNSPNNSIWITDGSRNDYPVLTVGVPLTGTRIVLGNSAGTSGIRIEAAGSPSYFSSTIQSGSMGQISYSGGTSVVTTKLRPNHNDIEFTGSTTIPDATTSERGIMSSTDKVKLNNIQQNAVSLSTIINHLSTNIVSISSVSLPLTAAAPSDPVTPVAWANITVNNIPFKLPLYQ
jgi:hypothetical protein